MSVTVQQSMSKWIKNTDLQLDTTTREALIDLLSPLMHTDNERQALLSLAFKAEPVYQQIDFDGSADTFITNMIDKLLHFGELASGEQALFALLEIAKSRVGGNKQKIIEDLISHINAQSKQNSEPVLTSPKLRLIALVIFSLLLLTISLWYLIPHSLFVWKTDNGAPLHDNLSIMPRQPISNSQSLTNTQDASGCGPAQICILVANISPEDDPQAKQTTEDIFQEINSSLINFGTPQPVVRRGPAVDSREKAQALATQEGAILVVWGQLLKDIKKLRIQFELVDLLGVGKSTGIQVERIEPLSYNPINPEVKCTDCVLLKIYPEVIQRAHMVAYTSVGLAEYVQGRPEPARFAFLAALYCAGEDIDTKMMTMFPTIEADCAQREKQPDWKPGLLYYYLGKSLILQGDYELGISYLEQASAFNQDDPAALISISDAYQLWLAQPKAPVAIQYLAKAEALVQNWIPKLAPSEQGPVYYDWGGIRELQGDTAGAQPYYRNAAELFGVGNPNAYVSLVSLGRVMRGEADQEDAEQTLQQASKLVPTSPWAYLELARLYKNEWAKAKTFLDQAEKYAPNEAYVYIRRAELCNEQWQAHQQPADYDCAVTAYAQALKLRPYSGWVYSLVGDFYLPTDPPLSGQNWKKAEEHYRKAAQLRPKDPWVHERLAYVLFNLKKHGEAVDQYNQAISLAHQGDVPARLYCSLGLAQQANGQVGEAAKNLERCSKASPQK